MSWSKASKTTFQHNFFSKMSFINTINFYHRKLTLRVVEGDFDALFGHLRAQKRLKSPFC